MIRRLIALLLIGPLAWLAVASAADDARPGDEDAPVRLKRKKKPGDDNPVPVEKKDEKVDRKKDAKKPDVPPPETVEEPDPPAPEEDEEEVLARLARNLRAAEDRLVNKELGDDTRQVQRDILKDLDSLIKKNEQGGGGGENQPESDPSNMGGESKQGGKGSSGGMASKQGGGSAGKSSGRRERQQARNNQGGGSKGGTQVAGGPKNGNPGAGQGPNKPGGNDGKGGNNPGAGNGKDNPDKKDKVADLYKDVWGHLPESLRAEMNAYSNEKEFMARYEELIIKYYKTIAEQGRRKGD